MDNYAEERSYPTPFANHTLLPLLLMSLVGKHTPDTKQSFRSSYDYIVVGAGAAGSVVASRLSEVNSVTVLLLEAGKSPPKLTEIPVIGQSFEYTDISWNFTTVPLKNSAKGLKNNIVPVPAARTVGGSSVRNFQFYIRGNRRDYDLWEQDGATNWRYEKVLPYFKKLERNLVPDVDPDYHGDSGPVTAQRAPYNSTYKQATEDSARSLGYPIVDSNGRDQNGFFDFPSNQLNGQKVSPGKAYLVPAEKRRNLDIVARAFVTKVMIRNKRAVGVMVDFNGTSRFVSARREVIMSAGALQTPQLLMLSGIGPREDLQKLNINVEADLPVGKNYQDHPATSLAYEVNYPVEDPNVRAAQDDNIYEYINNKTGWLAAAGGSIYVAFLNNGVVTSSNWPDHQVYFSEYDVEYGPTVGRGNSMSYGEYLDLMKNRSLVWCETNALRPQSRGTIKLKSSNPYDPPLIDPNYYAESKDLQDTVEGLKHCAEILNSEPMRQSTGAKPLDPPFPGCEDLVNDTDKYFACQAETITFTFNSHSGTAKMGASNDPRSVVDPELKVLGIRGLRVCDASVMPFVPSGNIMVPTLMVGEYGADIIKRSMNPVPPTMPPIPPMPSTMLPLR